MKKKNKIEKMTLTQWILDFSKSPNYLAGKSVGWKHRKVDQKLIDTVGGMENLKKQANELEKNISLRGKIRIGWKAVRTDIEKIEFSIDIIPLLCKIEGIEDPREHQLQLIKQITDRKQEVIDISWIQPYYDKLLTGLKKGNKMPETEDSLRFQCLNAIVRQNEPIWEIRFLKKLLELADENCEFLHWGDMDYGGISIFQFIQKTLFPQLRPYKMDRQSFYCAVEKGAGIPLEESSRKNWRTRMPDCLKI